MKRIAPALVFSLIVIIHGFSQELPSSGGLDFGLNLGLGVHTFPSTDGTVNAYQFITLTPDLSFGKIGVALDVTLHYRFVNSDDASVEIRREDWYRDSFLETLALYVSKIQYIRYGQKGEPLYAKLGSIEDALLGNGFIMSGYANTLHLPEDRYFGMSLDLDGNLFTFPYVGIETFISDLTTFDVAGARLYVRPLFGLDIPVIKNLQVGGTLAFDRDPYRFSDADSPDGASVLIIGADYKLPILSNALISLVQFADVAFANSSVGGMVGFGGRFLGILPYGAQIRMLGENFQPSYFDAGYDAYRTQKYRVYSREIVLPSYFGWAVNSGFSLFDDKIVFSATLEGPFGDPSSGGSPGDDIGSLYLPHLRVVMNLAEGILPGFFLSGVYDKKGIANFNSIFNPENALIQARINYKTGPAIITLFYDLKWNPDSRGTDDWDVTSGLETRISLF